MTIAYLGSTAWATGTGAGTTSAAQDTTGATLIVIVLSFWNSYPGTPTDNKGNTYTPLTQRGSAYANQRMFYCENPTVGTGHTFTQPSSSASSNVSNAVGWFSGTATSSAFDVESGGNTLAASITPSQNGSLIVSSATDYYLATAPVSVSGGFTKVQDFISSGPDEPACLAYLIQTTAANVTPTWSFSGTSVSQAHTIAAFKPGAGGGGGGGSDVAAMCSRYGLNSRNGYGLRR